MAVDTGELGILSEVDVPIRMRDGVRLRANVWRPASTGPYPAILMRTPYGKASGGFQRYVRAGYAVLCQDVRGRYASDGEYTPFTVPSNREGEDGYDSVEWVAEQPWCNGRVGTMGTSYPAWLQWALARLRPPHLVAMCACSIPTENTDVDWWGAFRPGRRIKWWLTTIAPDLRRRAGWGKPHTPAEARQIWDDLDQGRALGMLPWTAVVRQLPPPLDHHVAHWFDNPGARVWCFDEAHAEIEVPNFDVTGWYDHCQSLGHLAGMQAHARTDLARTQTKVVSGPYAHHTLGRRTCHDIDFGAQADLDLDGMKIRWFDRWLKGIENGVDQEPAVRYFVMGTGEWKSAETWPPPGSTERSLYLAVGDGESRDSDRDGSLQESAPSDTGAVEYTYDPQNPVPTLWTRALFAGASDRRKLDYRDDIISFRTAPLRESVEIAGRARVVLYASSSARDTDFFVRLIEEIPDGPAVEVAYGMVRARHRHGLDREDLLTPGEVAEFEISLTHTALCFRKGNRIRLDITSSDFPNVDRNHNVGRNDLIDSELAVARQSIRCGGPYPSRLVLPVFGG